MSGTGWLYRVHDDAGVLLYVGCTNNLERRLSQHRAKPWWPAAPQITTEEYPTPEAAFRVEQELIRTTGGGVHNVTQAEAAQRAAATRARRGYKHQPAKRSRPARQQLADLLLGDAGPLESWIRERRAAGRSWRQIERDLHRATNGEVDVTYETIRSWCPDPAEATTTEAVAS